MASNARVLPARDAFDGSTRLIPLGSFSGARMERTISFSRSAIIAVNVSISVLRVPILKGPLVGKSDVRATGMSRRMVITSPAVAPGDPRVIFFVPFDPAPVTENWDADDGDALKESTASPLKTLISEVAKNSNEIVKSV